MDSQETVALCLPVYDRVFPKAWFAQAQMVAELARIIPKENLQFYKVRGLPQPHAQNFLFSSVLLMTREYGVEAVIPPGGKRADWILWVEHDSCPPADMYRLLRDKADPVERPVMHGLSFDKVFPFAPSIWRAKTDGKSIEPIWDWQDDTMYRLAHSGTCGCLIHTTVFDRIKRPWFRMRPSEPGMPGMIPCISLSRRMHEANIPIYGYTGCIVSHLGDENEVNGVVSRKAYQMSQRHAQKR